MGIKIKDYSEFEKARCIFRIDPSPSKPFISCSLNLSSVEANCRDCKSYYCIGLMQMKDIFGEGSNGE